MNIKAIFCDVDGTLLNSEGIVTPVTIEAIRKARNKGILFGLSTGRDAKSVRASLSMWGIEGLVDLIVGAGGAELYDNLLQKESSCYPLDGKLIQDIMKHYEDMPVNFAIPWDGYLYAPKEDEHIRMLSKVDKVPYRITDFDTFLQTPKPKVMIVCKEETMEQVIERSKSFHHPEFKSASLKTAAVLYEYMDPRVSKTNGIKQILLPHQITMAEICTFGDEDNDYDMTENAGIGVVMANGSAKTKSVADAITDDNNHDGIGNYISQYLL